MFPVVELLKIDNYIESHVINKIELQTGKIHIDKYVFRITKYPIIYILYIQRCSTRLKRDRKKLIDHNRNTSQNGHVRSHEEMMDCVYAVMQQEWEQLRYITYTSSYYR